MTVTLSSRSAGGLVVALSWRSAGGLAVALSWRSGDAAGSRRLAIGISL